MITFNQLKNFLSLAEILHFARAAEKLGITQAALSRDIKKLETELSSALFDRSDKWNIKLTAFGKVYYEHLKVLPEMLEKARSEALRASRGETGTLRIIVHPSIYNQVDMSLVFQKMLHKWPEVKLKISDAVADMAPAVIENGECDVAFYPVRDFSGRSKGPFMTKKMFSIPLMLAVPSGHRLARKETVSMSDLAGCRFILPPVEDAPAFRRHLENILVNEGHFSPVVAQEARGPMATQNLVAASLGVGFVPATIRNTFPGRIVFRPLPFKAERTIVAAWLDNNPAPALQNFLSILNTMSDPAFREKKKKVRH